MLCSYASLLALDFAAQWLVEEKLRRKVTDGAAGRRGGMLGERRSVN